jgi:hypothetical protein
MPVEQLSNNPWTAGNVDTFCSSCPGTLHG